MDPWRCPSWIPTEISTRTPLPELRGLAHYAEEHGHHFLRIDAVAEVNDEMLALDVKSPAVRRAVLEAPTGGGVKAL